MEYDSEASTDTDTGSAQELPVPDLLVLMIPRWLAYLFDKIRPQVTVTNLGIVVLLSSFVLPDAMTYMVFYPIFRLVFGTLYPAYASYKAVRTKNVKEYVKWMMYWIVFALFTCAETFTDVFLSFWFPFYYEIKIILVLWLLSPATKGSSILYRKFVHPMLSRREQEIDEYIAKAKEQGYHTVLHLGTKGVNYATTVLMQTAIKGGGGLVNQIRRSYSLSDLSSDKDSDMTRSSKALKNVPDDDDMEEETDGLDPRMLRPRGYSPRRSASGSGRVEMYFPEVDVDVRQHGSSRPREPSIPLSHIRSSEDVSSGYSSAEPLYAGHHATKSEGLAASREPLVRTASVGSTRSMRTKSSRGGVVAKRGPSAEDSDFFRQEDDEAYCNGTEELLNDKSSNSSSLPPMSNSVTADRPSTPVNSSPAPIPDQNIHISSKLSKMGSTEEQFEDASDHKTENAEDGEEDLPFNDAETDSKNQSNDFSLSESLVSSEKHDISSVSGIEIPSSMDLTISASDIATNDTVPHPFTLSSEANSISEPSMCDSQNANVTVVAASSSLVDEIKTLEKAFQEYISSAEVDDDSKTLNDINSSTLEDDTVQFAYTASESKMDSSEDVSTAAPSLAEDTLSETLPALATSPLTVSSIEPIAHDNSELTESVIKHDMPAEITLPSDKTESKILKEDSIDNEHAYESVESLALPEQTSRSSSQSSLRKENRGGRYHKHPAPTPPSRTPEIPDLENENVDKQSEINEEQQPSFEENAARQSVSPTLDRKDLSEDTTTGSDDSEAAVTTARLVLKPGVVRSLGPEANTKAEVFVSKTPQSKSKKSKSKQKESGLSKFFALPKNSLTSLIPFWHGKQEPPSPVGSSSTSQNSNDSAFVSTQSSSEDSIKELSHSPGQKHRAPLADCE